MRMRMNRTESPTYRRRRHRGGATDAGLPAATLPAEHSLDVGRRLTELRAERGLSIRALAELSGLAVNTLSLIENGKSSPSVSTLQQIAGALGISIRAFFETGARNPVTHIKAGERPRAVFEHGALEDLGAGMTERGVQPFLITLEPNSGSGAQPIVHTGYEFVFCLEGRLTYTVGDKVYLLEPGDSLLFESHLPHQWHNVQAAPSKTLLVLCPADRNDQPTIRHFAALEARPAREE